MSLLVTGFGPFLDHVDNPSALLARASGERFEVLEVSFSGVDAFLEGLAPHGFDSWLALGLAAKATGMLCETVGSNRIGPQPDVRGEVHGPGLIDPAGPPHFSSSLWHGSVFESEELAMSTDAGGYLCNYLLYRALRRFPEKRIGFLHVPPFSAIDMDRQTALLRKVLESIA